MASDDAPEPRYHAHRRRVTDRHDVDTIWGAIDGIREDASDVATRTSNHEAVCAERYKEINSKLKYISYGIVILAIAQIFGLDHAVKAFLHITGVGP